MNTLETVIQRAVLPALAIINVADTLPARVLLLAIGLQESRMQYRRQIGGPARGLWQFEQGGGVKGVLLHPTSAAKARTLCEHREVQPVAAAVYGRLEHDDVLAAGFARLLLLTDPLALPAPGQEQTAWSYYLRNWRPGKPHPQTWPALYRQALDSQTQEA